MKKNIPGNGIEKILTGIRGLDEITYGGLPKGGSTLVYGNAGCGKTLLGLEYIYRGANQFGDPGVIISFEESKKKLIKNVASLGFDLAALEKRKRIVIDYIHIERKDFEETGAFDLEGLIERIGYLIDSIGAKRVLLDTLESLFAGITNHSILRAEIRRLLNWFLEKGVSVIITGEQGADNSMTREGLEEYVSDCVIFLDHRIVEQNGTRRMRIIKYRGSTHGTSENPFLITDSGISIFPISSVQFDNVASKERISTGTKGLDEMLGGKGIYRGSTMLVSGTAGTGKTSVVATFIEKCCKKGEKCIFVAFEESKNQVIRNMSSIGIDLKKWSDKKLLTFYATRPSHASLEMHLSLFIKMVDELKPNALVIDPVSSLSSIAVGSQANSLLTRLFDFLKEKNVTVMLTNLSLEDGSVDEKDIGISSLVDTWVLLRELENNGERNRAIYILKSRGMAHSNQVREFVITDNGLEMVDVLIGKSGIIIGAARKTQEIINKNLLIRNIKSKKEFDEKLKRTEELWEAKIAALRIKAKTQISNMKNEFDESIEKDMFLKTAYEESEKNRLKDPGKKQKRR
jgi:circadian clock protein KaiC